jgi:hypothetical protein
MLARLIPSAVAVMLAAVSCREARPEPRMPEAVPSVRPPAPTSPAAAPDARPARPPEIGEALRRVLPDVQWTGGTAAATGDFNGDGSPDLATVVQPADSALPAINSDPANWILQDPAHPTPPGRIPSPPPRVRVDKGDHLLVVIHGYGPPGWRSPEARQVYLIKVRSAEPLRARPHHAARAPVRPSNATEGDLLFEPSGRRFLYWDGAAYLWHGEAPR